MQSPHKQSSTNGPYKKTNHKQTTMIKASFLQRTAKIYFQNKE